MITNPTQDDPGEPISLEIVSSNALETMQRVEIDSQIATAKRYPRSMDLFLKRSSDMACCDKETAASCLYERPVGKDDTGQQKFAEGMSIRMAEIVAASFGNLRAYATLIEQTPRSVRARGMAIDLESNYASSSEVVESTVGKNGNPYSERQRALIAKVALAKARRDAIFQVVPRALARPVEVKVRALLFGDAKSLAERRAIVASWMLMLEKEQGISPDRVWAALGIKGPGDLNSEKLELLTGIKSAVVDGDVTWQEAFPPIPEDEKKGTVFSAVKEDAKKPAEQTVPTPPAETIFDPAPVKEQPAAPAPIAANSSPTAETPAPTPEPKAPLKPRATPAPTVTPPAEPTNPAPVHETPAAPTTPAPAPLTQEERRIIIGEVEDWIFEKQRNLAHVFKKLYTDPEYKPLGDAKINPSGRLDQNPDAVILAAQKYVRANA